MKTAQAGKRQEVRRRLIGSAALVLALAAAGPASAVIIYGGAGTDAPANDTAPAGFEDAWARTGFYGTANNTGTGVYLGNGFVLTARHIASNANTFTVDGTNYTRLSATGVTLTNADESEADLFLFRIAVPQGSNLFGLGPVEILDTSVASFVNPPTGVLIGTGEGQVESNPVTLPIGGSGFTWAGTSSRDKRWAEIEMGAPSSLPPVLGRNTQGFESVFKILSTPDGTAARNDSGAPVFYDTGSGIALAGLVSSVSRSDYARHNDQAYIADLAYYADQLIITPGDLNGDGNVAQEDLDIVLDRWGQNVQAGNYLLGDTDGDGLVGINDLDYILARWGDGPGGTNIASPVFNNPGTGVPEPTSLLLITGLLWGASGRRRRR